MEQNKIMYNKHSVNKLPKKIFKTELTQYKQVTDISQIKKNEIFKIQMPYIIGVDFLNYLNKSLIEKEIKQNIIYIKS